MIRLFLVNLILIKYYYTQQLVLGRNQVLGRIGAYT